MLSINNAPLGIRKHTGTPRSDTDKVSVRSTTNNFCSLAEIQRTRATVGANKGATTETFSRSSPSKADDDETQSGCRAQGAQCDTTCGAAFSHLVPYVAALRPTLRAYSRNRTLFPFRTALNTPKRATLLPLHLPDSVAAMKAARARRLQCLKVVAIVFLHFISRVSCSPVGKHIVSPVPRHETPQGRAQARRNNRQNGRNNRRNAFWHINDACRRKCPNPGSNPHGLLGWAGIMRTTCERSNPF